MLIPIAKARGFRVNVFDEQLKKRAEDLRYDADRKIDAEKRAQAHAELALVEAELDNRSGLKGFLYALRKILKN